MRRQTGAGGPSAGSSRALRLDPTSLPVRFDARDARADGGIRQVELNRDRVVLRRAVHGMRMAINVRVSDFLGVACRNGDEGRTLVLLHRDPSLSIPLTVCRDLNETETAWAMWSEIFALPRIADRDLCACEPSLRRRRRNAIRARRPKFLVRRKAGGSLAEMNVHADEREIIARN